MLLVLSALPLLLAVALLPVPPGSSWPRLAERAAWQWSLLQNTPDSYEWFYHNWASEAGQPAVAERIDDAAWARAVRANAYEDYAVYISVYSANGRHVVAAVNAADDLLWAQADSVETRDSYSTYLDKFPRGRHAQDAQDNLEEIAWRQIAGGMTIDNLSEFIAEFQTGRHLAEAQNALARLRQQEADAAAPASPVTGSLGGSMDGVPATNLFVSGAPVPLPRPRPHLLATADPDGSVPLPRPRPKSFAPAAPQTTPNPLGWLQGLFQPHQ